MRSKHRSLGALRFCARGEKSLWRVEKEALMLALLRGAASGPYVRKEPKKFAKDRPFGLSVRIGNMRNEAAARRTHQADHVEVRPAASGRRMKAAQPKQALVNEGELALAMTDALEHILASEHRNDSI